MVNNYVFQLAILQTFYLSSLAKKTLPYFSTFLTQTTAQIISRTICMFPINIVALLFLLRKWKTVDTNKVILLLKSANLPEHSRIIGLTWGSTIVHPWNPIFDYGNLLPRLPLSLIERSTPSKHLRTKTYSTVVPLLPCSFQLIIPYPSNTIKMQCSELHNSASITHMTSSTLKVYPQRLLDPHWYLD